MPHRELRRNVLHQSQVIISHVVKESSSIEASVTRQACRRPCRFSRKNENMCFHIEKEGASYILHGGFTGITGRIHLFYKITGFFSDRIVRVPIHEYLIQLFEKMYQYAASTAKILPKSKLCIIIFSHFKYVSCKK